MTIDEALAAAERSLEDCARWHLRRHATEIELTDLHPDDKDDARDGARTFYDAWIRDTLAELRADLEAEARSERHATVTRDADN